MPTTPSDRKRTSSTPRLERRADPDASRTAVVLRKVKGALNRPIALERVDDKLHVVLVERRKARPVEKGPTPSELRAELRARLLAHQHVEAAQVMRHLARVHDRLGRNGWRGVEELSPRALGLARVQAEMLASTDPSPLMTIIIEQLRTLKAAAEAREERKQRMQTRALAGAVEVSEATQEEFEAMERSWVGFPPSEMPTAEAKPARNSD